MATKMTLDALLSECAISGWRLTSLSDMSVSGLPRWWASISRPSYSGDYTLECAFGEGPTASTALTIALASTPRGMNPRQDYQPASLDLESLLSPANLHPPLPTITRRL